MNHYWQAIGWTLVHFLWQGAGIALVYKVVDLALVRRSANARYVLALAALLGMLNSCASNVCVVNIDSGFKGAYIAGLIARRAQGRQLEA